MIPALSPEAQQAVQDEATKAKIEELTNLSRITTNLVVLLGSQDVTIPINHAEPVGEIKRWAEAVNHQTKLQLEALQPKKEAVEEAKA